MTVLVLWSTNGDGYDAMKQANNAVGSPSG